MKKVSVVVPCYNTAEYLDKCVGCLLRQTIGIEHMEIILVDDASTDGGATWEVIAGYEQRYPDTITAVLLEENLRQGGARNVGVAYASGEYLIFCDADDWLLEEALEHCCNAAEESGADVVEFRIKDVTSREAEVEPEKGGEDRLIELGSVRQRKEFLLTTSRQLSLGSQKKLYRLSLIRENRISFAEHVVFEEPSFVIPVRLYEKRHLFLDEQLYVCFLSPRSTMRSGWEREHKWDNLRVWVSLMEDLAGRGLLWEYYEELEYLFLEWGFGLSVKAVFSKGCSLTEEEWKMLAGITLKLFPDIQKNRYIQEASKSRSYAFWEESLLFLLEMGTAKISAEEANQLVETAMRTAFGGGSDR